MTSFSNGLVSSISFLDIFLEETIFVDAGVPDAGQSLFPCSGIVFDSVARFSLCRT